MQRLVPSKRSPRGVERAKALLGVYLSFDRAMILFQGVGQVLHRAMAATAARDSFPVHCANRRGIEAGLIGVDDAQLRMRRSAEHLAEQRLAAAESRNAGNRKSIVAPVESTAR
jgi:hypothetical protein